MNFKDRLLPPGHNQIFQMEDYFVWGASVVRDESGLYHMFASRWKKEATFSGWLTQSEIVHATSSFPEGPFENASPLTCLTDQEWSAKCVHNPTVLKVGAKYYLFYMGTTYGPDAPDIPQDTGTHPARYRQQIGVAVADAPGGPWLPSKNNPILTPREAGYWDSTFVCNPSVSATKTGGIRMIYKAKWHTDDRLILGLAVAEHPEGPYERQGPSPLFPYDVEDPFVWEEDGRYWMVAKDMSGALVGKYNGVLLESDDWEEWRISDRALAWDHTILWKEGGSECPSHMERPQILMENGKPVCFYTAVGDAKTYSYNLARRFRA